MPFEPTSPSSGFRPLMPTGDGAPTLIALPSPIPDARDVGDVQQLLADARDEAAAEAREELEAEVVQLRELAESIGPLVEELEGLRRTILQRASEDIADVVRTFAGRVVGDALAMHPEALSTLVQDAIEQLPARDEISIAVSAESSEALVRALPPELRDRVTVDPSIAAGALVKTRNAALDATLDAALQGLEAALQEWLSAQWWVEGDHT